MVENRQIYPSPAVPALDVREGGVPYRWLEALVQNIKRTLNSEEEENSCRFHGMEHLRATYDKTLSPLDQALKATATLEERLREIRGLLPRDGEAVPPDVLARIKQLAQ